jgi:hypothetical protein
MWFKTLGVTTSGTALNFCAFARWSLSTRFEFEDYRDPKSKLLTASGNENLPGGDPIQLFGARRRYYSKTGEKESLVSLLWRNCVGGSATTPLNATDSRDRIWSLSSTYRF